MAKRRRSGRLQAWQTLMAAGVAALASIIVAWIASLGNDQSPETSTPADGALLVALAITGFEVHGLSPGPIYDFYGTSANVSADQYELRVFIQQAPTAWLVSPVATIEPSGNWRVRWTFHTLPPNGSWIAAAVPRLPRTSSATPLRPSGLLPEPTGGDVPPTTGRPPPPTDPAPSQTAQSPPGSRDPLAAHGPHSVGVVATARLPPRATPGT
jgi:hypothetical protein